MKSSYALELASQSSGVSQKHFVRSSILLLLAFASAFFSRLLDSAGAPSPINFLHFATVPVAAYYAITKSRTKLFRQISISQQLLFSLLTFLCILIISAIFNDAGIINVVLSYLLWVEAYFFLCAIICLPLSEESFAFLRKWLIRFSVFHIGLALLQKVLLDLGIMRTGAMNILQDNIQGVFYLSGGGHVVGASVSISFAIYCFTQTDMPRFRYAALIAAITQIVVADAKQVIFVALVSWVILILTKITDVKKIFMYGASATVGSLVLWWCAYNVEAFRGFRTWIRPEIYGPEGEATLLKSASIRIINSYVQEEGIWGWLFGLGPGHTVDRLGGWMIPKYQSLLAPLGVTEHPASSEIWDAVYASWLGGKSSMFNPLFGWAGLWGDAGYVGLLAYFVILWVIWTKCCTDDVTKFLLLTICVNGLIFAQMQEPGFMLYTVLLMGIRWQEENLDSQRASTSRSLLQKARSLAPVNLNQPNINEQ
ncbi:hypothetical protein PN498_15405 [Oscillatoria sp. CS-180]|uniref:hypothetical protein n=1 Tax=Oscillatoria sp. CS-180 TaxID=3021720 RepID=UPI0023300A98|nr:hypothetical protein [Oscillatoria sp. CS-180]MDB9527385.1 hypothetical protein [Oscillatoria sp. CS-180]